VNDNDNIIIIIIIYLFQYKVRRGRREINTELVRKPEETTVRTGVDGRVI
jgi:hypothetical protein